MRAVAPPQQGIALITAVLIVALGTLLATAAFRNLTLDLRRGQNLVATEQGFQYGRGLEVWARSILADDYQESGALDHHGEIWAHALPAIDVEGGQLTGRLVDLDGRFNVNNLVVDGKRQERQIETFRRLLTGLGLNPGIAEAVVDWQDPDVFAGQRGAEDGAYQRLKPPYRSANRDLFHVSELRAIAGIDEDVYQALERHVIALPTVGAPTLINVNTATPVVLAALDPAITESMANGLYAEGNAQYESVRAFLEQPQISGIPALIDRITVESRYFLAHGAVEIGGLVQHYHAVLERTGPASRVIYHSRGVY